MTSKTSSDRGLRIGLVVPHIFMHEAILPHVIFAPASLALNLAYGLQADGASVTLFSPGPVPTHAVNITADLSYFERELAGRGDTYVDLLKKHPLTFITLARQVQSELIAKAFAAANADKLDVVHIYTNEEDTALPFASLCTKPVVFTHHDPFNFSVKYKNVFPKYKALNWISLSHSQRSGMPPDTNWVVNIYHGLPRTHLAPVNKPINDYVAYLGRIIEPKGTVLAIQAIKQYNATHPNKPLNLKIAGKHYAGHKKDAYWHERILSLLDDTHIEYVGHVDIKRKQAFLGNARALLMPSLFEEPFGMVGIEALACGTPVIGLNSGAIPEIITDGQTGLIAQKITENDSNAIDEQATAQNLVIALENIDIIDRAACRRTFETRFTTERMCREHLRLYTVLDRQSRQ